MKARNLAFVVGFILLFATGFAAASPTALNRVCRATTTVTISVTTTVVSTIVSTVTLTAPSPTTTTAPTTTSTPPSSPVYWGAFMNGGDTYGAGFQDAPWDANTWNRFETDAGKKVSVVHYGQPVPWAQTTFFGGVADLVRNRGAIPAIDYATGSTPYADITNGLYDSQLRAWATSAAAWGHPFFVIWDVEMNGPWELYGVGVNGNTAAGFIAMWRHVHDVVAPIAPLISWVWAPNVDPGNIFPAYSTFYPGDAYVDWTGLDGFNQGNDETFDWLFGSSLTKLQALAPSKPVMITQTGSVEGGAGKGPWTTAMFSFLAQHPQVRCLLWFNWRIFENGSWWNWPIESSPAAQAAFAQGISDSRYSANVFGSLSAKP